MTRFGSYRSVSEEMVVLLNEEAVPVILNSFYFGNGKFQKWFKSKDFMDGMWQNVRGGNGDWTVLTPDGRFLGREVKDGMAKWRELPEAERKPGATAVKQVTESERQEQPAPPDGALVVRIRQRTLKKTKDGQFALIKGEEDLDFLNSITKLDRWHPSFLGSFQDVMWLPQDEWQMLIPENPSKGDRLPLPPRVKDRLLLWHLTNRTLNAGMAWEKTDLRAENVMLTVEEVAPVLRLRLDGKVLFEIEGTDADKKLAWQRTARGYDAKMLGFLDYDPRQKTFTRFDMAVVGDWWGGDNEGGRRNVDRLPLALAFELPPAEAKRLLPLPCGGVALDRYLELRSQFR